MTVKILLSIIALALSVCASAKIDYADYKKLQDAYQIPAPEAEKLSESGNPYAKLRSPLTISRTNGKNPFRKSGNCMKSAGCVSPDITCQIF